MSNKTKKPNILIGIFISFIFFIFIGFTFILNETVKYNNIVEKGCPGINAKSKGDICKIYNYNKYSDEYNECIYFGYDNVLSRSYEEILLDIKKDCYSRGKSIELSKKMKQ